MNLNLAVISGDGIGPEVVRAARKVPVSYTHLDVYKRQAEGHDRGSCGLYQLREGQGNPGELWRVSAQVQEDYSAGLPENAYDYCPDGGEGLKQRAGTD